MSWWIDNGLNYLEGDPNDPSNPPVTDDVSILEFLITVPQARSDFEATFRDLSAEAQARLTALLDANPFVKQGLYIDSQVNDDNFSRRMNSSPIYTAGPNGGKRIGG